MEGALDQLTTAVFLRFSPLEDLLFPAISLSSEEMHLGAG